MGVGLGLGLGLGVGLGLVLGLGLGIKGWGRGVTSRKAILGRMLPSTERPRTCGWRVSTRAGETPREVRKATWPAR